MTKSPIRDVLDRHLDLLNLLETHTHGHTALELMQKLCDLGYVSLQKRTIERDLVRLSRNYGVQCNDSSKPYRWKRLPSRSAPLPEVAMADALSLVLAEELLRKVAPVSLLKVLEPKFVQAQSRLNAVQKNRYSQWKDRVRYVAPTLPFLPPKVDRRVLGIVEEAIMDEYQINVSYSGMGAARACDRILNPLALVQCGPVAYLVAIEADNPKPILCAVHRIHTAQAIGERGQRPAGFSLDDYIAQGGMEFGEGGIIQLQAEVSTMLACYLEESKLSEDQQLKPRDNGKYGFEVAIKDSWRLQFWLLSQGAEIVVEKPVQLRNRIRDCLRSALDAYSEDQAETRQEPK